MARATRYGPRGDLEGVHELFPRLVGIFIRAVRGGRALVEGVGLDAVGEITVNEVEAGRNVAQDPFGKVGCEYTLGHWLVGEFYTGEGIVEFVEDLLVLALFRAADYTGGRRE